MKKLILITLLIINTSSYAQWVQVWNGMGQSQTVYSLFNNSSITLAGLYYGGIYYSTNEGLTWSSANISNNYIISDFTYSGTSYYATSNNGIYISGNGSVWSYFGLGNHNVYEISFNNNYIFAGTSSDGVFYSTNNGLNWVQSFLNNKTIYSLAVLNNFVIAGTAYSGIYYSTDNGYIWGQSDLTGLNVERLKFDGTMLYAGTSNGIYKSSNYGSNWVQIGLPGKNVNDLLFYGNYIYVGVDGNGIYYNDKQSQIWHPINDGLPTSYLDVNSLVFTNNYIIAATSGYSNWRRPKSQVSIENITQNTPVEFSLKQNYPNPFNPTTNIRYEIPKTSFVKIVVCDLLGKEIESLVNEKQNPGTYEVKFDASKYPSGVYFYKLISENFTETKKMILIK